MGANLYAAWELCLWPAGWVRKEEGGPLGVKDLGCTLVVSDSITENSLFRVQIYL